MNDFKIYMAPLQGLTEAPFRNAFDRHFGGVDTYYTPFARWEHGGMRRKDVRDVKPEHNTVGHLVPQLVAASADEAELLVRPFKEFGFHEVDLNMGCAFPAIAKKRKGCGMLPYPEQVKDLLQIIERHPDMSFSVKMRLGYENVDECMELLPILNASCLSRIVVHARTGKQQYKENCDWMAFERFARACSHPVIYNGDLTTLEDIRKMSEGDMPLAGVMIGRGLLATPWMVAEFKDGDVWTEEKRMTRMRALHADLFDHYARTLEGGEKQLLMKMKSFWEYLLPDADRKIRKKIHKAQKITDYTNAVFQLLH